MGLTCAGTVSVFVYMKVKNIDVLSDTLHIALICSVVVVCLLFAYAIYASCCGRKCAKFTLGVLFLCYTVVLILIAVLMYMKKDSVLIETAANLWINSAETGDVYAYLEDSFGCKCWNVTCCATGVVYDPAVPTCQAIIAETISKYWDILAGTVVPMAVLMLIGVSCAFGYACFYNEPPYRDEGIMYSGIQNMYT